MKDDDKAGSEPNGNEREKRYGEAEHSRSPMTDDRGADVTPRIGHSCRLRSVVSMNNGIVICLSSAAIRYR